MFICCDGDGAARGLEVIERVSDKMGKMFGSVRMSAMFALVLVAVASLCQSGQGQAAWMSIDPDWDGQFPAVSILPKPIETWIDIELIEPLHRTHPEVLGAIPSNDLKESEARRTIDPSFLESMSPSVEVRKPKIQREKVDIVVDDVLLEPLVVKARKPFSSFGASYDHRG